MTSIFLKMEDDLKFLKMEDDLNIFENGRWHQFLKMEDDVKNIIKQKKTIKIKAKIKWWLWHRSG
jgi:hypothetical protein